MVEKAGNGKGRGENPQEQILIQFLAININPKDEQVVAKKEDSESNLNFRIW